MIKDIFLIFIITTLLYLIIFSPSPLYSILWWILLICISCYYLISLGLGFISFSYFILYIGAIIILFLFVIMTLHNYFNNNVNYNWKVLSILTLILIIIISSGPGSASGSVNISVCTSYQDILPALATPLYTFYSFLWFPTSLLLLTSLLFPISLLL